MAKITKSDVTHLASLSNVSLDDQEVESLQRDLEKILNYIEQLAELEIKDVKPTYQVGGLKNIWREDRIEEPLVSASSLLALSPSAQDNQIKVPKVL